MAMEATITIGGLNDIHPDRLADYIADRLQHIADLVRSGHDSSQISHLASTLDEDVLVSLPYVHVR